MPSNANLVISFPATVPPKFAAAFHTICTAPTPSDVRTANKTQSLENWKGLATVHDKSIAHLLLMTSFCGSMANMQTSMKFRTEKTLIGISSDASRFVLEGIDCLDFKKVTKDSAARLRSDSCYWKIIGSCSACKNCTFQCAFIQKKAAFGTPMVDVLYRGSHARDWVANSPFKNHELVKLLLGGTIPINATASSSRMAMVAAAAGLDGSNYPFMLGRKQVQSVLGHHFSQELENFLKAETPSQFQLPTPKCSKDVMVFTDDKLLLRLKDVDIDVLNVDSHYKIRNGWLVWSFVFNYKGIDLPLCYILSKCGLLRFCCKLHQLPFTHSISQAKQ
jgi:hypothetical protein